MAAWVGNALAGLRLAGAGTIPPLAREIAERFKQDAGLAVDVQNGDGEAGMRAVLTGAADIGMIARALSPEEARQLNAFVIGFDGIAIAVNERNPVAALTQQQVRALFTGRIADWREIGKSAPAGSAIPVIRAPGRAARQLFDQHFGIGGVLPIHAVELGTDLASLLYLSSDPQAVGYVSVGALDEGRRRGLKVKSIALDGIEPSLQSCMAGKYPLCWPLLLVTRGAPRADARRFVEFLASPAGRAIAERHVILPEPAR
ncbi:MAG: hypothetical protein A2045_02505 [Rhodocyclales bacterium GWA2_65_20]|nr:MAG: hypothetical protein A2045_02505 [Rhodocyclales bacterium GWA2_65_20]